MGCTPSKKSLSKFINGEEKVEDGEKNNESDSKIKSGDKVNNETELDKLYIEDIKKDLCDNPEMFVLNNLLMAVMFFENYPRVIMEIRQKKVTSNETCYCPDTIMEKVNENVLYRTKHGQNKFISEPLVPKIMYILNHNIKVLRPMEEVGSIESSLVRCEESRKKGFTRLREIVASYSPDNSPLLSVDGESTTCSSGPSSVEDYVTIEEMRNPRNEIFKTLETQTTLPKSCIEHRKQKKIDLPQDIKFEDISEDDLYEVVSYISSKGFMEYFHKSQFPRLAKDELNLKDQEILQRRRQPGKITCKLRGEDFIQTWDIIPSVPVKWPGEQTLEFTLKSQRSPGVRTKCVFPNPIMIGEVMDLGALLVPKGCYAKDRNRKEADLEWEICFPQAEKYLETYMTHSQMKCYLFFLCIYKTYIAPITFEKGLTIHHIKTFFLAQIDKNFMDWPEHKLGSKLFSLLKQLNILIGSTELKDYFVSEKKPLFHLTKKYLRENQRILHDIIESPLMACIKSLKNLQYVKGGQDFYRPIDFDKLYSIVTQTGIQLLNPNLPMAPPVLKNKFLFENADSDTIWIHVSENVKWEKKRLQRKSIKQKELAEELERKKSEESLDLSWVCEKSFDLHKKRAILRFFIDIFLDISRKSKKFSWYRESLFYLKQAKYLAEILQQECAAFGDEVQEIMNIINRQEPKLVILLRENDYNSSIPGQSVADDDDELPSIPLVNGNRPHFNFERNKLKSEQEVDVVAPKSAKTSRRKTVAFNFVAETMDS